jgi:hypothetical protein
MLDEIKENLRQNLDRVESLVQTYESHPDAQGQGRKSTEVLDILRAAVVLLHASLEDVLRKVAGWKLPATSAETLNEIPLVGLGSNPKKFLLGDLVKFRGKTIEQVFQESVDAHLEQSNYNNPGEIASLLRSIGVDVAKVESHFAGLGELMKRRHQIVHRADWQKQIAGSGDHWVGGINKITVRGWAENVRAFADALFLEL